jgi:integrase
MAHGGKPTFPVTSGHQGGSQAEPQLRSYKLTPAFVRRIATEAPPTKEVVYADQSIPRHSIRVRPPTQPGKPWPVESRIRYTLPGGRRVWLTTGNPRTMSLDALRVAARAALAIVDGGADPAAARAARRAEWTVRDLWGAYSRSPEFGRLMPLTRRIVTAQFTLHIVARIGNELLTAIDVPTIRRLIRAIHEDARTNVRKRKLGGPGAARKAVRVLSSALSWAVAEGELGRNPLRGAMRLSGDGVREAVITQPEEYARLFATLDRMVADGRLRPTVRAFLICSALTGLRRGELQTLRWEQVDLSQRRIVLHDAKGAKLAKRGLRRETLSLPSLAAVTLAEIRPPDAQPTDQVFPSQQGRLIEVNRAWVKVRREAGLPPDLTLHGLRHSLGTSAVLSGLSGPEVQALLRHRTVGTTSRYLHLAEQISVRLQDRATARLTEHLDGSPPPATIHPLPRRRA